MYSIRLRIKYVGNDIKTCRIRLFIAIKSLTNLICIIATEDIRSSKSTKHIGVKCLRGYKEKCEVEIMGRKNTQMGIYGATQGLTFSCDYKQRKAVNSSRSLPPKL
jgi:hypothetical protein